MDNDELKMRSISFPTDRNDSEQEIFDDFEDNDYEMYGDDLFENPRDYDDEDGW